MGWNFDFSLVSRKFLAMRNIELYSVHSKIEPVNAVHTRRRNLKNLASYPKSDPMAVPLEGLKIPGRGGNEL